ncbi:MAG: cytidine deaminase [Candidatus Kapabacteria bacterium]|nr:cytidine deaminase [Candidatus Kapabacteria bacterium]MDW8011584.1 cytidine deaminase [Bacteroidota bacterium]
MQWREAHASLYEQFVSAVDAAQRAAPRALQRAWAPYSGFPVGAALLAVDGSIWDGCNVECSSYGLTLCAERIAVGHAVVHGHHDFVLLVLTTDTDEPILPCGACRQLLHDFSPHLLILSQAARSHRQALW